MSTKNTSILKDMETALTRAHNTNNKKAISKDFAAGCGVSEKVYGAWTATIDNLHANVTPWVAKFNDKDATEAELKAIYDKVFPTWKKLAKVSDTPIFIRESDVVAICRFAAKHGQSANGSVDVVVGKVAFRREIETMLGIRLAQNKVLNEDNYDTIVKYERAEKNLEKAENRLNGYVNNKGEEVDGLTKKLSDAKETLRKVKNSICDTYKKFKQPIPTEKELKEDESYKVAAGIVADLEATIKSVEGNIAKNKETISKLGKEYKEIMATINKIK